jgi:hypothetical protein
MNNLGVCPESCGYSESVQIRSINPRAWEWELSLACMAVMSRMKRRQGGKRGVRVSPESYIVEGADIVAHNRRQHLPRESLSGRTFREQWLTSRLRGKTMEQERPNGNHRAAIVGVEMRRKTGAVSCKRSLGVGLSHSSDEPCEEGANLRVSEAKGRAEQGTQRRER